MKPQLESQKQLRLSTAIVSTLRSDQGRVVVDWLRAWLSNADRENRHADRANRFTEAEALADIIEEIEQAPAVVQASDSAVKSSPLGTVDHTAY